MDERFVRTTCPASGLSTVACGGERPVLLLHGLGWDGARLWAAQAVALADQGHAVIMPDLRGTGESPSLRAAVGIADLAGDVARLLAARGILSPLVVGFSMGAMVAAAMAEQVPVRGLVLACGGLAASAEGAAATEAMLARAKVLGPVAFATEQARSIFGLAYHRDHSEQVANFVRWRSGMDQESLAHAFRAPFGVDLRGVVSGLRCPVHLIAADEDQFLAVSDMAALAQEIGAETMTVIARSGHMAPVERPEAFNAALLSATRGI